MTSEKAPSQFEGWKRYCRTETVFTIVLMLGLFGMASRSVVDPDLWWHLKTGQLTLQHHAVFRVDPYSFTCAGQPWINHEWLADVLMFSLYRAAGWGGLIVVFAALISTAYFLIFRRCAGRPYLAGIMTVWAAFASLPVWDVRPQIFSLLLASMFLMLRDLSVESPRRLWWAVPLTLLWVNLHAGYALGIALLALFMVGELLDAGFGFAPESGSRRTMFGTLSLVLIACLAVVPINPYGFKMYWYPIATLRLVGILKP